MNVNRGKNIVNNNINLNLGNFKNTKLVKTDRKFIHENITLLILCTVDSKGVIHTGRSDPRERLKDITTALPKWFKLKLFKRVIIIENSNYQGSEIKNLMDEYSDEMIGELIIYDGQKYNRGLGKGYGWYSGVSTALSSSKLADSSDYFMIIPGRYFIPNIVEIMDGLRVPLMCNLNNNLSFAFSPVTVFSKKFLHDYWLPECKMTNDSIGLTMEHCQARAVLRAIADGYEWQLPAVAPQLDAISGTSNLPYYRGVIHSLGLKYYSYIKKFIFEFKR